MLAMLLYVKIVLLTSYYDFTKLSATNEAVVSHRYSSHWLLALKKKHDVTGDHFVQS